MLTLASPDGRQLWLLCLLLAAMLLAGVLRAQELPIGFLDYLGSMVEQDGELVDPLALEEAKPTRQEDAASAEARADAEPRNGEEGQ